MYYIWTENEALWDTQCSSTEKQREKQLKPHFTKLPLLKCPQLNGSAVWVEREQRLHAFETIKKTTKGHFPFREISIPVTCFQDDRTASLAASKAIILELSTGSQVFIENQWIDLFKNGWEPEAGICKPKGNALKKSLLLHSLIMHFKDHISWEVEESYALFFKVWISWKMIPGLKCNLELLLTWSFFQCWPTYSCWYSFRPHAVSTPYPCSSSHTL